MNDDQPLTCVRCWHAPASRLLVIRWREETMRLLCTDCAAKDEADAPGLPSFRSLTVLAVGPVSGMVTEWGACRRGEAGPFTSSMDEAAIRRFAEDLPVAVTGLVRREVTPWVPVPGEEKGND